ncbi:MAG TPA: tetratricopeptide repeat protein, partial [Thermoanaerobaculia bacterium]|nr:tetratricopeptide repeat protein [Thermoanaerobaculia bacterium]
MPRRGRDSLFAVAFAAFVAATLGACAEAPPAARVSRQHAGHAAPAPGFLDLRGQARQAREQGDLGAAAELLAQAHRMAPQNPVVSLHLAEVLAATGDRAAALGQLQRLAAGGVSMDLVASPELARLAGDPRFASLLQAMERNRAPIARAEIVC